VPKSGLFVTLEGPDGSGKSTQRRLLAAELRKNGFKVVETREPGGSPLAEKIRALLLDIKNQGLGHRTELLLFEAARFQHLQDTVLPALKQGQVVLCDRFSDSTVAYQGAGRAIALKDVQALNRFATQGLKPDLTLVYDLSAEEGLRRSRKRGQRADRMEAAAMGFHRRVRAAYLRLAKAEPRRIKVIAVQAKTPQAVAAEGLAAIARKLA
jgi:dTMP kinase